MGGESTTYVVGTGYTRNRASSTELPGMADDPVTPDTEIRLRYVDATGTGTGASSEISVGARSE